MIALGVVLLGGCEPPEKVDAPRDGGPSAAPDGVSLPTAERFAFDLAGAHCAALWRCGPGLAGTELFRAMTRDVEGCRAGLLPYLAADVGDLQRSIAAGAVRFDPAGARRYLDRVASVCRANFGDVRQHGYGEAYVGAAPVGGACERVEECAGEAWCDHGGAGAERRCPGVCRARIALGEACGESGQCSRAGAAGEVQCLYDGDGGHRCVDVVRTPAGGDGAPCGTIATGPTRATFTECGDGLYCPRASGQQHCRRLNAVGESCTGSAACVAGAACVQEPGGLDYVEFCRPYDLVNRAGEACSEVGVGARCNPFARLACVEGTCRATGDGRAGAACARDDYAFAYCDEGFVCDTPTRTCQPARAGGAACTRDEQCALGVCLADRGSAGVCAARICY